MLSSIRSFLINRRWRALFRDLDAKARKARAANDCRAIGRVEKERRERVHAGLRHATGWRSGSMGR